MVKSEFKDLELTKEIQKAVAEMGFQNATEIQSSTIPLIMEGIDVIGHSKTGTGKTAAFGIPAIMKVDAKDRSPQVLILCPTRELALQASDEIRKFAKYTQGIRTVAIYGGQPINRQILTLKQGAQIVIGTPGRIMDHMRRKTLRFKNLKLLVLDEADEMLNMGFRDDIETILKETPEERQTILFSATMSKEILAIMKKYQKSPKLIKTASANNELTVSAIKQYYIEIPKGRKNEVLYNMLDSKGHVRSIIFCNTKKMVDELARDLQRKGYAADGLHGDMKQMARNIVMNKFKKGHLEILIATDVAARGIDVENIEVVYNYDVPQDLEYYVHRIGRTGRAGKDGVAYTFIAGRSQMTALRDIERFTKSTITKKPVPGIKEASENKTPKIISKINEAIYKGNADKYKDVVTLIEKEGISLADAVAALISMQNK